MGRVNYEGSLGLLIQILVTSAKQAQAVKAMQLASLPTFYIP